MDESHPIGSYERRYQRLFASFRESGWAPGRPTGLGSWNTWFEVSELLPMNDFSLEFLSELEGKSLRHGRNQVLFFPDTASRSLVSMEDYERDIVSIAGPDAAPVAEGGGKVLFVNPDHRAFFIDQTLCGVAYAKDPFALLEWHLFDLPSDAVRVVASHPGARIAEQIVSLK